MKKVINIEVAKDLKLNFSHAGFTFYHSNNWCCFPKIGSDE